MKTAILFLGLFLAVSANKDSNSKDLSSIPLCATLNNVHKTFANIWEVYNEFKTTGQLWFPVATSACPVAQIDCKTLSPVCAVTQGNFFKTFPNQCVLEAEQKATDTAWTIVFNGICSTNPADGFPDPIPQANNYQYQPSPLNSIPLTLGDAIASLDLSPSESLYPPISGDSEPAPTSQQSKPKNVEPLQPCSSDVPKQYNSDKEPQPSPSYPEPPSIPYDYDERSSQVQPASAEQPAKSVHPPNYENFMLYAAPSNAEQAKSNSKQLPTPDNPKETPLLTNYLPSYYSSSHPVPNNNNSAQKSPIYPLSPILPSSYNKNSVQGKSVANAMQPLHTNSLISAEKEPPQNPLLSNSYEAGLSPALGYYSSKISQNSPIASNNGKVSDRDQLEQASLPSYASASNAAAPSSASPVSDPISGYNTLVQNPQSPPIYSIPGQYSVPEQPEQSPPPFYALPSYAPKPSESMPPPMIASCNTPPEQSQPEKSPLPYLEAIPPAVVPSQQPQEYPLPYSEAVPPAAVPVYYNSIQESKPLPASPTPFNYGQVPVYNQMPNGSPSDDPLLSSDSQKSLPSPGYRAPSSSYRAPSRPIFPVQPNYNQKSLEPQPEQTSPPSRNYNSSQAAQSSLNYAVPSLLPSYYDQVSPPSYPKAVQLPSPVSIPNDPAGPYSSVQEKLPSYDAKSSDASADNKVLKQSQTSSNCSATSSSYGQGCSQAKSAEDPPLPDSGLYSTAKDPQLSPKYPPPSPLPANYAENYVQGQPKKVVAVSSLYAGLYSKVQEPMPSAKYPVPSPLPADYGRNSAKVQPTNVADHSSVQEQQSPAKYSAPSAIPSNYGQNSGLYKPVQESQPSEKYPAPSSSPSDSAPAQPKEAIVLSCSPNYDSIQEPRPSFKHPAPSPVPATPDQYSAQPQSKPNHSIYKDSPSPSADVVKERVPSSNPTSSNYIPSPISSNYNSLPKLEAYPKYPPTASQSSQPSQNAVLLPLYVKYNSEQKPEPSLAPSPILSGYGTISTQVQPKQSPLPSHASSSYDESPSPTYSAPSYSSPSAVVDDSSPVKNFTLSSSLAPSSSHQGYECPLSSLSSSPIDTAQSIGNSYANPSPNSYEKSSADKKTEQEYQQSSNTYSPSSQQSSPGSYSPSNSEQYPSNDITYSNTQTYNQSSSDISVTSDESNNSYPMEPEANSNADKPEDSDVANKSSQNIQDEAQIIYNGAVYQGPYYYEPKYKHINFGNFNFLPPQSSSLVPAPSTDPPLGPANPSANIPETQYPEYNMNPFELLLKQLQYIAAKNGESSY